MSEYLSFLISIYEGSVLLKVALKIHNKHPDREAFDYALEPENKERIKKLLPAHCDGEIIDIEEIFECVTVLNP